MTTQETFTAPSTTTASGHAPIRRPRRHSRPLLRIAIIVVAGVVAGLVVHGLTSVHHHPTVPVAETGLGIVFSTTAQVAGERAAADAATRAAQDPALGLLFGTSWPVQPWQPVSDPALDLMFGTRWPRSDGAIVGLDGQAALFGLIFGPNWP